MISKVRALVLPLLTSVPSSLDDCLRVYLGRLERSIEQPFGISASGLALAGYVAWPNDADRREAWLQANNAIRSLLPDPVRYSIASSPVLAAAALADLQRDLARQQAKWLAVADVFQVLVDIAHDSRPQVAGGPSISKAMAIVEAARGTVARAQLAASWSSYRDVSHLIAAGAAIALQGMKHSPDPDAGSILMVSQLAPDALVGLAAAYERFGLSVFPHGQQKPVLNPETVWGVPQFPESTALSLPVRRLTDEQIEILQSRRAARK